MNIQWPNLTKICLIVQETYNILGSRVWLTLLERDIKCTRKCNRKRFVIAVVSILRFKLINVYTKNSCAVVTYWFHHTARATATDALCLAVAEERKTINKFCQVPFNFSIKMYVITMRLCLLLKETNQIMSEQAHYNIYFDLLFSPDKRFKTNYTGCHLLFWLVEKLHSDN